MEKIKIGTITRRILGMNQSEIINHDFNTRNHLSETERESRRERLRNSPTPPALRSPRTNPEKNRIIEFQGATTPEEFRKFYKEEKEIHADVENMIRVNNGSSFPMPPSKPSR